MNGNNLCGLTVIVTGTTSHRYRACEGSYTVEGITKLLEALKGSSVVGMPHSFTPVTDARPR